MKLIIKASDLQSAKAFALNRGLSIYKAKNFDKNRNQFIVHSVDGFGTETIIAKWFAEDNNVAMIDGYGYPNGTLVYYRDS